MNYTQKQIKDAVLSKGYKYFESGDYDVNIIAIRTQITGNMITNKFDDFITLSFTINNQIHYYQWPCTTDPGTYYMRKKLLSNVGCARIVPGQYRKSHTIRKHQGKYEAVCQQNPIKIYRDANLDNIYDEKTITEGVYGINIHKSGVDSQLVENWSAGCIVFKREKDFNEFMIICKKSRDLYGNSFSLTLLNQTDIK